MTVKTFCGIDYDAKSNDISSHDYILKLNEVLKFIRPKPSPYPLIRIGNGDDGSYLVPDAIGGIAACFSPGVDNFKNFEDHLSKTYEIRTHMCDFSSDLNKFKTPLIEGMQTFDKLWLEPEAGEHAISLRDLIQKYDRSKNDLMLQMDIEGAEYRNIIALDDDSLQRFRIIVIELHDLDKIADKSIFINILQPFFEKISRYFTCVHAHPNNCCPDFLLPELGVRVPVFLELTLIRNDYCREGAAKLQPIIPHPLDIGRNVRRQPPLFLDENWLEQPRPLEARHKMLSDKIEYVSDRMENEVLGRLDGIERALKFIALSSRKRNFSAPAGLEEIAVGKSYRLSSAYDEGSIEGTVPEGGQRFFFHTDYGVAQSITIDLQCDRSISLIEIENRRDMCFDRAKLLFLMLMPENNDAFDKNFIPIDTSDEFLTGLQKAVEISIPVTSARYVTIISPLLTYFHLSAIRVFAERAAH
ncbi:hypothetical protein MMSR116_29210 [Methylobacterium mesophilicum SR1.6/6]|uniref:Methyltransferase FkbM domain-containing protein n=1 Tax=Methylobacterium mesophilicum SR1.6/6 TaxID=908290 RepID=A0A6B9FSW1_9HYPH|nr:FkbM family methyltransferase [Methylobacterium mesophilicum]QGY05517.1 hypothetical protein MMSR116_29210 [Methylobacterium mesophilicum SR1.6/6]